jgi:hypothetical protein
MKMVWLIIIGVLVLFLFLGTPEVKTSVVSTEQLPTKSYLKPVEVPVKVTTEVQQKNVISQLFPESAVSAGVPMFDINGNLFTPGYQLPIETPVDVYQSGQVLKKWQQPPVEEPAEVTQAPKPVNTYETGIVTIDTSLYSIDQIKELIKKKESNE